VIVVEPTVLDRFTHGLNLVVVGDAGCTSHPGSGQGCDLAIGIDAMNVMQLGKSLAHVDRNDHEAQEAAIREYNRGKGLSACGWCQSGKMYFRTEQQARRYKRGINQHEVHSADHDKQTRTSHLSAL